MKQKLLSLFMGLMPLASISAQQLAFPDAQGWGRYAKGARAVSSPTVYHVTNLNDSGSGSLRDAVSQSGRIVVFDVSGVIKISSRIVFAKNIYVAGQTAPGEGITVYGDGVSFSGSDNIICRYLRIRMGHGGSSGKDCAGVANGANMIFDHCSFSWGLDETFSINSNNYSDEWNITIQNSIIGQGLMTHSAGGLMQGNNISLYRNLYCDNSTRNNKVKGTNQFSNNIVYNWKNGGYIMGGDSQGTSYVNIESNLFINGPAKGGDAFTGANADFHCYGNDNWQDSNENGIFDPYEITKYSAATREPKPYPYPEMPLWKGNELIEKSLPTVGASLPYRDQADCYMVDEVLSFGKEGALITYETSLPIGAPDTWAWWKGEKMTDSDNDGMPDWWENANGTNPNKNDACVVAANGYLNIENYINSISMENRQFFLRRPVTITQKSATTSTMTIAWRDYTENEEGFAVEVNKDGEWKEMARTSANAKECKISGLESGTEYKVRVRAFAKHEGNDVFSDYSDEQRYLTRPIEVGMVDIDTYEADVTNSTEVADGQKLLLNADAAETLNYALTKDITPQSVVVTGKGTVKVSGNAINGSETSMNKSHEGTLILENKNSYKGATVNHGGTIEFNSIANGGEASAIGASQAFAANWVFDGGTYRYTGGKASSNRSARIDRDATLDITSAELTMTGKFEGKGGLTIDGNGILSISNADFFSYSGATTLKGSKIALTDTENACKKLGSSGKKFILSGGTMQFASKNEDYQTLSFPIEVTDETTSILSMPTHCYFRSVITGNGTLQFDIPYLRAYLQPNLTNFTGQIVANGTKSGALFLHEKHWNASNVRFNLKNGITMAAWDTNASNVLGGLSGDAGTFLAGSSKQTKGFTCSWQVGGANSDETFNGVINNLPAGGNSAYSGTVSIKKVGTGSWKLTGNNVYSGTTDVENGELIVNGNHTGTGAVSVASGATLKGKGTLTGKVSADNGATICAGDEAIDGSILKLKGGLALKTGSTLIIPFTKNSSNTLVNNSVAVTGNITVASGARLELDFSQAEGVALKRGDALTIFSNATGIKAGSGSFTISPATPGEGLEWETSTLLVDGQLRVKNEGEEYHGGAITTQVYNATLEHTASVQGGKNPYAKYLDTETHYYNNWGYGDAWYAQAYVQFTLDIPSDETIEKAELTFNVNCGGSKDGRSLDVCYMPAGTSRITSTDEIPELRTFVGTSVAAYTDISRSFKQKVIDVTVAVKAMVSANQNYILFVMANGAAGGEIYGKGSSTNAPKLTITTTRDPNTTGINDAGTVNRNNGTAYTIQGIRIQNPETYKGLMIVNGKKLINR